MCFRRAPRAGLSADAHAPGVLVPHAAGRENRQAIAAYVDGSPSKGRVHKALKPANGTSLPKSQIVSHRDGVYESIVEKASKLFVIIRQSVVSELAPSALKSSFLDPLHSALFSEVRLASLHRNACIGILLPWSNVNLCAGVHVPFRLRRQALHDNVLRRERNPCSDAKNRQPCQTRRRAHKMQERIRGSSQMLVALMYPSLQEHHIRGARLYAILCTLHTVRQHDAS